MATLKWARVFFHDQFVGLLRQEPGAQSSFTYDPDYLSTTNQPIAWTLPLQEAPHMATSALPAFFDNLVAEGWMAQAQRRLLGRRQASRFDLLLAFGHDCSGAVSVQDPEPQSQTEALLEPDDQKSWALLQSHASLSGVQPKLALIQNGKQFVPVRTGQLSTYLAKFSAPQHPDLLHNEWLTSLAFQKLLPNDTVASMQLGKVQGIDEEALIIKRFDRTDDGQRIHFEEFNQLLGHLSEDKYEGAYEDMSAWLQHVPCSPLMATRLFERITAGFLLGNTDMHFKNFSLFAQDKAYVFTPSYDQVGALIYDYNTLALSIAHTSNLRLKTLKARHVILMARSFGLNDDHLMAWVKQLEERRHAAAQAIEDAAAPKTLKLMLVKNLDAQWNQTFSLIGNNLSKKP